MDLLPYVDWFRFTHVLGAFIFVLAHGVSVFVAFRIRGEQDPVRISSLLDLSSGSLTLAFVGLLVVLVSGIVTGIVKGYFGQGWIWVSLVLLIVIGVAMTPMGATHYSRIRAAVGQRTRSPASGGPDAAPVDTAELAALLDNRRPEALAAVGGVGFLVLLWLMMFRPF